MRHPIIWLITDTHFYHNAMIEACGRPANFTDKIVKNCKHLVAEQDTLIHLGDVIFYRYTELKDLMAKIKGKKILTVGNHDKRTLGWYQRNGFDIAVDTFTLGNVVFSHRPQRMPFAKGVKINVHGHHHNNKHRALPQGWSEETHRLLAIENTDYAPVRLVDFVPDWKPTATKRR